MVKFKTYKSIILVVLNLIPISGQLPEYVGSTDRFWRHHKLQKTLIIKGEEKYDTIHKCIHEGISKEEFEMMKLIPSDRKVGRRILDDPESSTGNIILVEVINAITPIHVKAVKTLASCVREHIPSLHEKRPMYLEFGLKKDPGLGGNSPTHLAPLINIFFPDVVDDMIRTLQFAYEAAGWNQITIRDEIAGSKYGTERTHIHPEPKHLGFRASEHLTYNDFPSLADHTDGMDTAYTLNYAFTGPDDYEGGFLYLKDSNQKKTLLKPEKYTAFVFLGGIYTHGVTEIKSGFREAFSTETWFNPDIPVGTTLWSSTSASMEEFIWKCNEVGHVASEGPCSVKFSELTANGISVQQNQNGEFKEQHEPHGNFPRYENEDFFVGRENTMNDDLSYRNFDSFENQQSEMNYDPSYEYYDGFEEENPEMYYDKRYGNMASLDEEYTQMYDEDIYENFGSSEERDPQMHEEYMYENIDPFKEGHSQIYNEDRFENFDPFQEEQLSSDPKPRYKNYEDFQDRANKGQGSRYLEHDYDGEHKPKMFRKSNTLGNSDNGTHNIPGRNQRQLHSEREGRYFDENEYEFEDEDPDEIDFLSATEEPNFLIPKSLPPGVMYPLIFRDSEEYVDNDEAFSIGLPPQLLKEFQNYIESSGLLRLARRLIYEDGAYCKEEHCLYKTEDNLLWGTMKTQWDKGDMVWIDPADEKCFERLMSVLRRGNFDTVLETIGDYFGLDGLMIQGIGPIFLSHFGHDPDYKQVHTDLIGAKGSFFNVVVPLYVPDGGATLYVGDDERTLPVQMRYNVGTLLGAESPHGTGECDYRGQKDVRLSVAIYVADVNDENLELVASDSTSLWPTIGDIDWFAKQKGRLWRSDGSRSLKKDKGRSPLNVKDLRKDCKHLDMELCVTDPTGFRLECPKRCGLYLQDDDYYVNLEKEKNNDFVVDVTAESAISMAEAIVVHELNSSGNIVGLDEPSKIVQKHGLINNRTEKGDNSTKLIEWLRSNDGFFNDKIAFDALDKNDKESPQAIFALAPIKKNETVLIIPANVLITAGKSRDMCDTARNLAKEYILKDASKFEPYVTYVFESYKHRNLPAFWSKDGKNLFAAIIGKDLEPQDFGESTFDSGCGKTKKGEKHLEAAWSIVLSRSWNDVLIPVYDMINHRNGRWHNVDQANSAHQGEDIVVVALRDINPGEQLYLSYNECNDVDCYGYSHSYTLPSIVADYGFVEQYPRRFNLEILEETVVFELDKDDDDDEISLTWMSTPPSLIQLNWVMGHAKRLKKLQEEILEGANKLASHERELIIAYYQSLTTSLEQVILSTLSKDSQQQRCDHTGNDDRTCNKSSLEYNTFAFQPDTLDYSAFACSNDEDDGDNSEEYFLDEVESHYQNVEYSITEDFETGKTDTCLRLSGWLQTCSSFRPHYHENLVHYPASFLKTVKRVLFLGGGDNMILHEILKYDSLELVVGMELDQQVVRTSFKNMGVQPHFDRDVVQWWFGDASKSLKMLPQYYYGTFDLVLVDLQTFVVNTLKVTEDKRIMDIALLLLRPNGVLAQNEDFVTRNNVDFAKFTVDLEFSNLPMICRQSINMGSNTIDFLRETPKSHGVDTLIFESATQTENHFKGWSNYRANVNRSTKAMEDLTDYLDSLKKLKATESYGFLMILEIENVTVQLDSLIYFNAALRSALEKCGLTEISLTKLSISDEESKEFFISLKEGYIILRVWPKFHYCGIDVMLWDSFDKQDFLKTELVAAFGGESSSSYRIATGGQFGIDATEEEQPQEDVDDSKNFVHGIEDIATFNEDWHISIYQEIKTFVQSPNPNIIVFCSKQKKPCQTLDALRLDKNFITHVVALSGCPEESPKDDSSKSKQTCEMTNQLEFSKSISSMGQSNGVMIDPNCDFNQGQLIYKMLTDPKFVQGVLMEQFVMFAPTYDMSDTWRKSLLELFRTKNAKFSPSHVGKISFNNRKSTMNLNIFSCNDEKFYQHLRNMVEIIEIEKKSIVEVHSVTDGILNYDADSKPLPDIKDSDYDKKNAIAQWKSQHPLGKQIILQYEVSVPHSSLSLDEEVLVNLDKDLFYGSWYSAIVLANRDDGTHDLRIQKNKKINMNRRFIRKLEPIEERSASITVGTPVLVKNEDLSWSPGALLEELPDSKLKIQINDHDGTVGFFDGKRVMRRDESSKLKNPLEITSDLLEESLRRTLAAITPLNNVIEAYDNIGEGCLVTGVWPKGNVVSSWDGKAHIDFNLFTYDNDRISEKFRSSFSKEIPFVDLVALDEQPRGHGRVVNFIKDVKKPPFWTS